MLKDNNHFFQNPSTWQGIKVRYVVIWTENEGSTISILGQTAGSGAEFTVIGTVRNIQMLSPLQQVIVY